MADSLGFDLVGAEDRPNSISFYRRPLVQFQEYCKKEGVDIPFLFHAGESLRDTGGSENPQNSNLYDAIALQAARIGHGFALRNHPQLLEHFREIRGKDGKLEKKGICVELCPISNEILHLCRNVKEHPFPLFLAAGIPCCLNPDNPNLFR